MTLDDWTKVHFFFSLVQVKTLVPDSGVAWPATLVAHFLDTAWMVAPQFTPCEALLTVPSGLWSSLLLVYLFLPHFTQLNFVSRPGTPGVSLPLLSETAPYFLVCVAAPHNTAPLQFLCFLTLFKQITPLGKQIRSIFRNLAPSSCPVQPQFRQKWHCGHGQHNFPQRLVA